MKTENKVWESLEFSKENAYLNFSDRALAKMLTLIATSPLEVGWHGTVLKTEARNYDIGDVFLYPQEVSPVRIDCNSTDEEGKLEYAKWQCELCLEDPVYFDTVAFHGHSHVDMPTFSSSTDQDFQTDIIEQLQENAFYIFLIANKRLEFTCLIVDREDGKVYTNVKIDSETFVMKEIQHDYKQYVKETTYGYK